MSEQVIVGEKYQAKVKSIGAKGDPMISIGGFFIFINAKDQGIQVGDEVVVHITKKLDKVGFGDLVEVL
jgi:predicted RNA-binding protein with TRAM domain